VVGSVEDIVYCLCRVLAVESVGCSLECGTSKGAAAILYKKVLGTGHKRAALGDLVLRLEDDR
jgi:hypothetical protein